MRAVATEEGPSDIGQWYQDIKKQLTGKARENFLKRLQEIELIAARKLSPFDGSMTISAAERERMWKGIASDIECWKGVEITSCTTQKTSYKLYAITSRNWWNRNKAKVYGNHFFYAALFVHIKQAVDHLMVSEEERQFVFVDIFDEILHTKIQFPQTRAQPIIPHQSFIQPNKFKYSSIDLLKAHGIHWNGKNIEKEHGQSSFFSLPSLTDDDSHSTNSGSSSSSALRQSYYVKDKDRSLKVNNSFVDSLEILKHRLQRRCVRRSNQRPSSPLTAAIAGIKHIPTGIETNSYRTGRAMGGLNAFSDANNTGSGGMTPLIISPLTMENLAAMNNANLSNHSGNGSNMMMRSNLIVSDPNAMSLPLRNQQVAATSNLTNMTNMNSNQMNMNTLNLDNLTAVLNGTLNPDLSVNNALNPGLNGLSALPQTVQSAPTMNGLTMNQLTEALALLRGVPAAPRSSIHPSGLLPNPCTNNNHTISSNGFNAPCTTMGRVPGGTTTNHTHHPVGYGGLRGQSQCVADHRYSPSTINSPLNCGGVPPVPLGVPPLHGQPVKNLKCLISTDPNSGQLTFSLHFPIT